jgi:hypothetical protein
MDAIYLWLGEELYEEVSARMQKWIEDDPFRKPRKRRYSPADRA